jgi:hypothetical protein
VLENDDTGNGQAPKQQGQRLIEYQREEGNDQRGNDRPERDIPAESHYQNKNGSARKKYPGNDGCVGSKGCGHAFSAPESDREGKAVTQNSQKSTKQGKRRITKNSIGEKNGKETLQDIDESDENAGFQAFETQNVRSSRAPTAVLSDILITLRSADNEITGWYGTQKMGGKGE